MKYDLFFKNNATNEVFQFLGIEELNQNPYYLTFEEFELPDNMGDGEYTYVVFANILETEYRIESSILDSVAIVDGKEYPFRMLKPLTGLMKVGTPKNDLLYKEVKNKDNNYYYDGK
jgi:hypothetical protein